MPKLKALVPIREEINDYYRKSGISSNNGKDCPSFGKCRASCKCEEANITPPTGPYVGKEYEKTRILFVGINTNDTDFDPGRGQEFYNCYSWISSSKTESSRFIDGAIHKITRKILDKPDMTPEESRQYFAFTNVVKCSVDKKRRAGGPTKTMCDNCEVRQGYLFKEIEILSPRMIVTFGELPYHAIRSHYVETVSKADNALADRLFLFALDGKPVITWLAYNPGGYRNPRRVWNNIKKKEKIKEDWRMFVPKDVSPVVSELKEYFSRTYKNPGNLVLQNCPWYEMMLDKLITVAKDCMKKEHPCD